MAAIARVIAYAVDVAGVEHVALGSDFDGAVSTCPSTRGDGPASPTRCSRLACGRATIARVMGGNAMRVLADVLPD